MPPLLILFFVLTIIFYAAKQIKLRLQLNGIPGPTGYPVVGNTFEVIHGGAEELLNTIKRFTDNHGSRFVMWLGLQPYVVISNGPDLEKILSSQKHIEKSQDYELLYPWLGLGLLTSGGNLWQARRKMLTPAFHFSILEDFLTIMNEQSEILVSILNEKRGTEFDIFPVITRCALDIICETAMGKKVHAQEKSDSAYVRAVYRISELVQHRQLRPWLHPDTIFRWSSSGREHDKCLQILHDFTNKVIKERKKDRAEGKKRESKKPAFLDILLEHQANSPPALAISDESIREEVDTFMFEGHDTTAANMNWTLYLIGLNPLVQAKVHEEIDRVLGRDGSKNKQITSAQLTQLKYLELCIKESLRIYPSVPLIGRKIVEELKLDENTSIPPGVIIMPVMFYAHRDPTVFPDPLLFKPERWLEDEKKNPFSYVPFSAGPRNCIGQKFAIMEEKVVLAKIFKDFKVKSLEQPEKLILMAELILRPKNGIKVLIEKRE